ncbi:MAG: phenylacetate-CoA oxygenase subunit PaaI, partial [Candidatus Dormibacteraeota bacterium]|nr:phenylacetate-CoA oxygenase subunit PaaI [Candidatus Dormibacteraeota bacterium]
RRVSLGTLILSLADNKQLLGLRYAEWATRAPSLESDIAAAAMGLDELGHSRVLYGCVEPLGGGASSPERDSDARGYLNLPYFDRPWQTWAQFVAANAILDTAFTVVLEACLEGDAEVLRTRLRKMVMEERYHFLHGRSWLRSGLEQAAAEAAWRQAFEWFGPPGGEVDDLQRRGALALGVVDLRSRLGERLETAAPALDIDWSGWDARRRRSVDGAIDERTFAMLRGLEERRFAPVATNA